MALFIYENKTSLYVTCKPAIRDKESLSIYFGFDMNQIWYWYTCIHNRQMCLLINFQKQEKYHNQPMPLGNFK